MAAFADLRYSDCPPVSAVELQDLLSDFRMTVVFYRYRAYSGFWLLSSHGHN
jgi:hypothetical protein